MLMSVGEWSVCRCDCDVASLSDCKCLSSLLQVEPVYAICTLTCVFYCTIPVFGCKTFINCFCTSDNTSLSAVRPTLLSSFQLYAMTYGSWQTVAAPIYQRMLLIRVVLFGCCRRRCLQAVLTDLLLQLSCSDDH